MPRMSTPALLLAVAASAACSGGGSSTGLFSTSAGGACPPGMQITCTCAGGGSGVQVCAETGDAYGACLGCPAGSGGSGQGGTAGHGGHATSSTGGPGSGGAGGASTTGATTSSTTGMGGTTTTTSTGAGGGAPVLVYAHDATRLFTMDPSQPATPVTEIGTFDCVGGASQDPMMLDFAVSSQGALWGVSARYAYQFTIAGTTVHCGAPVTLGLAAGSMLFGLSFAPAGVIGGTESLVGADTAGNLWAVDTASGALTQHGTFGTVPANDGHGHTYANAGQAWELSGDLVFTEDAGSAIAFATVRDCPTPPSDTGCNATDTLIELDVSQIQAATTGSVTLVVLGQVVKSATCNDPANTSYGRLYGIAAYGDQILGFSHSGAIVSLSSADGSGCLVQSYATDLWSGAGITDVGP
jgi:hypothetical protein